MQITEDVRSEDLLAEIMTVRGIAQEDGVELPVSFRFTLRRNPFRL